MEREQFESSERIPDASERTVSWSPSSGWKLRCVTSGESTGRPELGFLMDQIETIAPPSQDRDESEMREATCSPACSQHQPESGCREVPPPTSLSTWGPALPGMSVRGLGGNSCFQGTVASAEHKALPPAYRQGLYKV